MAKDKLTEYDATAANNTVVGDVNLAENSALPSDMNNAVREVMSHLKEFADGTNGINVLTLADDDASASIKFQAPSAVTTTVTFTLPDGDGESGQTLVTNGSGTLAWHAPYGNRNLIINGAMQVAQRGTSSTGLHTSGYYTTDRFALVFGNEDELRVTMSQNSVTDLPGFANSLKVQTTTAESAIAADETYYIINRYEGQDFQQLKYGTSSALSTTLSFYVKSSVTGTFAVAIYQTDGNDIIGSTYTINSANTWEKKEITFAGNTLAAIVDDNTNAIMIDWFLAAGSNFTSVNNTSWGGYETGKLAFGHGTNAVATTTNATWEITGVQWELGEQATPFEHEDAGTTLRKCQRFYQKSFPQGTAPGSATSTNSEFQFSFGTAGNQIVGTSVVFPTLMRASPTLTLYDNAGTSGKVRLYSGGGSATDNIGLNTSNATDARLMVRIFGSSAAGLGFMYQADAEL